MTCGLRSILPWVQPGLPRCLFPPPEYRGQNPRMPRITCVMDGLSVNEDVHGHGENQKADQEAV